MKLTNDSQRLLKRLLVVDAINLIVICDRFHVCGEWVSIHKQHQDVSRKCLNVLYEWVLVHKQHQDVSHKCLNVLYEWVLRESQFQKIPLSTKVLTKNTYF
jgi:hypothetical protein